MTNEHFYLKQAHNNLISRLLLDYNEKNKNPMTRSGFLQKLVETILDDLIFSVGDSDDSHPIFSKVFTSGEENSRESVECSPVVKLTDSQLEILTSLKKRTGRTKKDLGKTITTVDLDFLVENKFIERTPHPGGMRYFLTSSAKGFL